MIYSLPRRLRYLGCGVGLTPFNWQWGRVGRRLFAVGPIRVLWMGLVE